MRLNKEMLYRYKKWTIINPIYIYGNKQKENKINFVIIHHRALLPYTPRTKYF